MHLRRSTSLVLALTLLAFTTSCLIVPVLAQVGPPGPTPGNTIYSKFDVISNEHTLKVEIPPADPIIDSGDHGVEANVSTVHDGSPYVVVTKSDGLIGGNRYATSGDGARVKTSTIAILPELVPGGGSAAGQVCLVAKDTIFDEEAVVTLKAHCKWVEDVAFHCHVIVVRPGEGVILDSVLETYDPPDGGPRVVRRSKPDGGMELLPLEDEEGFPIWDWEGHPGNRVPLMPNDNVLVDSWHRATNDTVFQQVVTTAEVAAVPMGAFD